MKKSLLLSAALLSGAAAYAAGPNLVINGSFSAEVEQTAPYSWNEDQLRIEDTDNGLTGWKIVDGGQWNGGVCIYYDEPGDDDPRPEEDESYASIWGYDDNGWTDISINQVVSGLTVGTTYTFRFQYCFNIPTAAETSWSSAPDPDYGVVISEVDSDAEGNAQAGRELWRLDTPAGADEWSSNDAWIQYETEYTATASEIYLSFRLGNYYYEGNKKSSGLFFDLDNIEFFDPDGEDSAVANIAADSNVTPEYYNLQGMRVNKSDDMRGLYIVKQGSKVSKKLF